MTNIEPLKIMRHDRDVSSQNIIFPGDRFTGSKIVMRKRSTQEGRAMKAGEVIDDVNGWGDPFCVTCVETGDHFLLWTPGNEKEWFINDASNFAANYEILEHKEDGGFTCQKKARVTAFVIDRPMAVHGKEQNRDPAQAEPGDLLALDADGDPYRIPKSHYTVHYQILEGEIAL